MNRQPYPAYKPSGIEWLGEIPAHWEEKSLKHISRIENSGAYGAEEGTYDNDVRVCTTAHIGFNRKFFVDEMPFRSFTLQEVERYKGIPGDIFVVKSSGSNTNIISGKLAIIQHAEPTIVFTNFLMRIRPISDKISAQFLAYLLSSSFTRQRIKRMVATTTYPNIDVEEYSGDKLPLPTLNDQHAIAAYLDCETVRLDALIEKKQRQIELLQEKRTALISRSVTKGLDPNAKMKDSGVEWLGEIPAHWQVRRLRYLASGSLMYGANEAALETDPSSPRFVRITDISEDGSLRPETFKSLPSEIAEPYLLREGDVLLARSGATVGKTFIYRKEWGKACFAGYLIRFPCNRDLLLPDFLFAFTRSHIYWSQIRGGTIQATIQNFNAEKYGELLLPLPPLTEQHTIVSYLDVEGTRIDTLIEKIKKSVTLLREYRTSLISTAVTGKIDVRKEPT